MELRFVYITADGREEAERIGRGLIEARLAACVNIIDNMTSMYWWEGRVQDGRETVLIAKTTEALLPRLVEQVKQAHGYECPCVVALPVLGGNRDFLDWIGAETEAAKG